MLPLTVLYNFIGCLLYIKKFTFKKIIVTFPQGYAAWAFPKRSPYIKIINHQLNRMQESGLMKKIIEKQVIINQNFNQIFKF